MITNIIINIILTLILLFPDLLYCNLSGSESRYVRIGSLQSHFTAYGSERAWNNSYYEGMIWPADYDYQDNAVIKRAWISSKNYTDPSSYNWDTYSIYLTLDYVETSVFPIEFKQVARFEPPIVYVDGIDIYSVYGSDIDQINPNIKADRLIINTVNTSMGLTLKRKIHVFSQQYHDNYFIKEFIFINTGNTDYDDEVELNTPLNDLRIGWGYRYSGSREGATKIGHAQNWGRHNWFTKRGENYSERMNENIDENNPIVDWLRCGFQWTGQSSLNSFNNVGAPDKNGNGRLTSPQHAGICILHVDKNPNDNADDPNQPNYLGWHGGGTFPSIGNLRPSDLLGMQQVYDMISGNPHLDIGSPERVDEITFGDLESESYLLHAIDPYSIHNDGGGMNIMICYGPFNLNHGDSIRIVEVEGINGINRQLCEIVGKKWQENTSPFLLPNGDETNNRDIYKNSWIFTGKDSIMKTFGRAKRNFDNEFNIPLPPLPPSLFNVRSGGDRIYLTWAPSPSEIDSDFAGYKIFRSVGKPDTTYEEIYSGPAGEYSYEDLTATRGFSYYYYISSFNDGSNNIDGTTNPKGQLSSNRFYTKTTIPAFLRREAGKNLNNIRVVPNPFHISAKDLQYTNENNKIMFLNIPPYCEIKIFTERGDLINTIKHSDGSGDESWDSLSETRQLVSSGIYIAHFKVTKNYIHPSTNDLIFKKGDQTLKKFMIIR
ncbi:MAG: fibronectin [Candidatus Marinimicrobia bacterium]|nr:fibronectin [Candidatus Neomarinimicrobiota bacterium]|tara:strand:+ start:3682 stop:5826 length:2145 start_codon:yes stop_codon:yes gene_type:complete